LHREPTCDGTIYNSSSGRFTHIGRFTYMTHSRKLHAKSNVTLTKFKRVGHGTTMQSKPATETSGKKYFNKNAKQHART